MSQMILFKLFILIIFMSAILSWPEIPPDLPELRCDTYEEKTRFCVAPPIINSGFYWNTTESTITFTTRGDTRNSKQCQIYIEAQSVIFILSNLTSCDIYISASTIQIFKSTLSTSGSIKFGKGYTKEKQLGNCYAAYGGFCSNASAADLTYGDFDTSYKDDTNTYGSGGETFKGGGKIVLIAEGFYLENSIISANGYPTDLSQCGSVVENGGTGGYIYAKYDNIYPPYGDASSFEAKGGCSCSENTYGGSGGRIILNGSGTYRKTLARGGSSNGANCNFGGSGTVYYPLTNKLLISNELSGFTSLAPTTISSNPNIVLNLDGGTFVIPKSSSFDKYSASLIFRNVFLLKLSKIGCPEFYGFTYRLNITAKGVVSLDSNAIISCNGELRIESESLTLSQGSSIVSSGPKIFINTTQSLYLSESKIFFDSATGLVSSMIVILTKDVDLSDGSSFNASYVFISTDDFSLGGKIVALNQTCFDTEFHSTKEAVNPLDFGLLLSEMHKHYKPDLTLEEFICNFLPNSYTLFVLATKTITIEGGKSLAARTGLFTQTFTLGDTSHISSDGQGCACDLGPGHGISIRFTTNCGSTGGGYGGRGGIGAGIYVPSTACLSLTAYGQKLYSESKNAIFEGSGGASYQEGQGGSGGGVIVIGVMRVFEVQGKISSNGLSPLPNPTGEYKGAGSGSGGSVQIYFANIFGTGRIEANGGDSCETCSGGEGGGGRIRLNHLLISQKKKELTGLKNQYPSILASRGKRLNAINAPPGQSPLFYLASNGSISSTSCMPGSSGVFCDPCDLNTYKSDFSNKECTKCHSLDNTHPSPNKGQDSYICTYTCSFPYNNEDFFQCANNIISFAFHSGIVYLPFIAMLGAVIVVIFIYYTRKSRQLFFRNKERIDLFSMEASTEQLGSKKSRYHFTKHHVQRIYLFGDNLPENKWFINIDLINLKEISPIRERIDVLRKEVNRGTFWKKKWMFILKVTIILNYCLYLIFLHVYRLKIVKRIQKVITRTNEDLRDFCKLKIISTYYIHFYTSVDNSFGYLDVFQEGVDFTDKNCHQALSIMLTGNGTFFSPYYIEKHDELFKHFIGVWADHNSQIMNRREKLYFKEKVEEFLRTFNKIAKFIDYYSGTKEYAESVYQLISYLKLASAEFADSFGIYFYLYGLEIPKFTVEETDMTQQFLQSPIRATFLTGQNSKILEEFIEKAQRIKFIENSDAKLCLLINSNKIGMVDSVLPVVKEKEKTSVAFTEDETNLNSSLDLRGLQSLKDNLFKKLDDFANAEEYSIPKELVGKFRSGKRELSRTKYYKEPKKYFIKVKKFVRLFFQIKSGCKKSKIYGILIPYFCYLLFLIWFKITLFIKFRHAFIFLVSFLLPFPLAQPLSLVLGVASILTSNYKVTQYFMVLNLLSLFNNATDVIGSIFMVEVDPLYILNASISSLVCLVVQILSNYLADVHNK